jgi:hypothetical protein
MEVLYQLSYPGEQRRPLRGPQGTILEGLRGSGAAAGFGLDLRQAAFLDGSDAYDFYAGRRD